ncbi:MAG: alpha/beta hydrolase family protein [Muribaculaceae bacterium]|nr:alpha/beta hydrolase family protein [Muribaculaceae bacterium]
MKKLILTFSMLLMVTFAAMSGGRFTQRVDTAVVNTKHLATPMKATVLLPDSALKNPDAKFPTVYLLNGFSGDYRNWIERVPRIKELSNRYGLILVMPDGRDSWYWDSPIDPQMQMESFFVKDLVPYIDANYPTKGTADQRAISGLSMGGHGALWLGMRHPELFKSAASMSGGVDIRPFPKNWKMAKRLGKKEDNPEVWEQHTVINLVPQLENGQINLLFDCGKDDFFAEVNENLHKSLVEHGIDHDYITRPGKHSWDYWRNSVLYHLLFFKEQFDKARKQPAK